MVFSDLFAFLYPKIRLLTFVRVRGKGSKKIRQIFYNKFRYENRDSPNFSYNRRGGFTSYKFVFNLFKEVICKNPQYFKEKLKKARRSKFTRKLELLKPETVRRVNSSLEDRFMVEFKNFWLQQGEVWDRYTEYERIIFKARWVNHFR